MSNTASALRLALIAVLMGSVASAPAFAKDKKAPAADSAEAAAAAADAVDASDAKDVANDPSPQGAGAYLAARVASQQSDFEQAAHYYRKLMTSGDVSAETAEATLASQIAIADYDHAVPLARQMVEAQTGSQIAAMAVVAADAKAGNWPAVIKIVDDEAADPGPLLGGLAKGWALVGEGKISDAAKAFDALGKQPALGAFASYHKALSLALVGDYEGANAILSGKDGKMITATRRGVIAQAEILSQLERDKDAVALIDDRFGPDLDPQLQSIRDRLAKGETLPFTIVRNASDGVAEVYYSVAQALIGDAPDTFTLMHTRMASYIEPDMDDATLMTAALLDKAKQYDLAIAAYASVKPDSPIYQAAEIGRAESMVRADRNDAAIEVLENLSRRDPQLRGVWTALGDTLRREQRYGEAAKAYDKAIALIKTPQEDDWFVYYSRAIAQERSGDWKNAEAGFREALKLSPDQPAVLNYLGYSYVDKGENLDEALAMIRKAVKERPQSGFIVDSLGWALYKTGNYKEAVTEMERAVSLEPRDPLLNDHLGDVLWAVGRKREARFQWSRALSFGTQDDQSGTAEDLDLDRVREKLSVGLDQVLKDEGAPPLKPIEASDVSN
ncbi:Flp pilus assembly protein TadD, contains TPR repeats [Thioclava dalianensis]|uniref:tetratricopeptide repeat protein n=1 Tax=Thioclava dalianensis TaxID=1185766 RepID=UPI0008F63F03|nr:tetratricopeptide repeat protein [Thioclava dalianensis]SFM75782.1 Flp pilus assembly protein TadD, contains TPR repeats [Thioclava dalianensis]